MGLGLAPRIALPTSKLTLYFRLSISYLLPKDIKYLRSKIFCLSTSMDGLVKNLLKYRSLNFWLFFIFYTFFGLIIKNNRSKILKLFYFICFSWTKFVLSQNNNLKATWPIWCLGKIFSPIILFIPVLPPLRTMRFQKQKYCM